jgi:hypothetical protein
MTNNQILTTGDNWRQLAEAVCFKVRYFRQFASSASPYKGRQTGVAETDPGVSIRGWGMWCLTSATATSTLSSGGEGSVGDAAALDSLEASAWCQAARPHSNASTASGAASAMAIGPALAPKPTTDAINARLISLSCDMSPVCLSADGPFVPSSVCVSGRAASA